MNRLLTDHQLVSSIWWSVCKIKPIPTTSCDPKYRVAGSVVTHKKCFAGLVVAVFVSPILSPIWQSPIWLSPNLLVAFSTALGSYFQGLIWLTVTQNISKMRLWVNINNHKDKNHFFMLFLYCKSQIFRHWHHVLRFLSFAWSILLFKYRTIVILAFIVFQSLKMASRSMEMVSFMLLFQILCFEWHCEHFWLALVI